MQLAKTHKFFLSVANQSEVQVYPVNDKLEFEYVKAEGEIHRKVLNTELIFQNTPEHATFDQLFELEKTLAPCVTSNIRIEETCRCGDTETVTNWNGIIPFRKGKWDAYSCLLKVKPTPNDAIKCILDKWNVEQDVMETVTNRVELTSIIGQLEYFTSFDGTKPVGYGWTLFEESYIVTDTITFADQVLDYERYVRQVSDSDNGVGWELENGKYYSFVPLGESKIESSFTGDQQTGEFEGTVARKYKILDFTLDNTLLFSDVINFFLGGCGITIVSNFFGINPDLIAPDNTAYRYATENLQNLVFAHASDVINEDASENATKFNMKWSELWHDLKKMFFLQMFYDEENTTLYIEHESFQSSVQKLNVSTNKQIKGFAEYEYIDSKFPKEETYHFAFDTGNEDFDNAKIEYATDCSNQNNRENSIKHNCQLIVTNVAKLYNNNVYQEDDDKMFKTVLLATNGSTIMNYAGVFNTNNSNGALAFTQLIRNLHIYERPLEYGNVNGLEVKFDSVKKQKIQTIEMTLTCDTINNLKPNYAIQTIVGLGDMDKLTIEKPSNLAKITLNI